MSNPQDKILIRKQYALKKRQAEVDYRESRSNVKMTTDISNFRALFSKSFPHPDNKTPHAEHYQTLVDGIINKDRQKIVQVSATCPKLVDVYCTIDNEVMGIYKSTYIIQDAPNLTSEHSAAELLELYGMALSRDVLISEWSTSSIVQNILSHLNLVKDNLHAPLENGNITVKTLFRGPTTGDLIGPYVSQFLYYPVQFGALPVEQKYQIPAPNDFMKTIPDFLNIWNGGNPTQTIQKLGVRHLLTIRDCANYIHLDPMWQPFFTAASILLNQKIPFGYTCSSRTGARFIHLGVIDLYEVLTETTKLAMDTAWVYKWCHLKARPEEMAYQTHLRLVEGNGLDFPDSLLTNPLLSEIHQQTGNYLLPQAYPEGSPCHPAYPSGHATIAGAMSTILKAWFDTSRTIKAKIPNQDGSALVDYMENGQSVFLNIGDELDKLASNCGIFRNFGGIHYRSDLDGVLIGEMVGIKVLKCLSKRYACNVTFNLKKRDGTTIQIKNF
jgi:membrane-associated phospholipid phosphatase